jgi:hypothetical protein
VPGKNSQASTVAPSISWKSSMAPGRDKGKKGVLVNTPTLSWAYTRTLKERGEKREICDSIDIVVLPIQWEAVYLSK